MKYYIITILLLAQFAAQAQLQKGKWRGVFTLKDGIESPFNFEVTEKSVFLLNGDERFELKGYRLIGDSVYIPIDIYDAALVGRVDKNKKLSGEFLRFGTPVSSVPFTAEAGKTHRFFETPQTANVSLAGTWDFTLGNNKTVGLFSQKGNKLTGTLLTTTGDYRYFEGSVKGSEFFLSAFSGSSPSLIRGKVDGNSLTAEFVGFRGVQNITGLRNDKAALPDAYTLTSIKENTVLDFTFPDAFTGKPISLNDPKYKGKALIVTILGSWCPNCIDEAEFLAPWYAANKNRGVEIIGLAFERKTDTEFAKQRLQVLKDRFGIQYDILFAGIADKKYASDVLPALSEVLSFPTTIYIDKNGKVRKIHTGYTGPATGKYFEEFVKEFNKDVDELLKTENTSVGK